MFPSPANWTPTNNQSAAQIIRISQFVCAAMVTGVLVFMIVALLIGHGANPVAAGKSSIIPLFAVLVAVNNVVMLYLISGFVVKSMTKTMNAEQFTERSPKLAGIFQVRMIIRVALLEGAAFFNLIEYLIDRQWWSVAVAGVLIAIMLMNFPTMNQFDGWADELRRSIENQF